ncbi:MAG: hypothetical protein A2V90_06770 [Gammaproteobacteria bacterium RBG_16_57_12]|nr:MAG: hypothetical protein A2V90_06770 [Gammaproteobacteria bacterium RBG_16_57_12]
MGSTAVSAEPVYHPSGPNLTYGAASVPQTIVSSIANPAAAAAALGDRTSQFRIGVLTSIGAGYEVGQVDNFTDDLDHISNLLDATYTSDAQATAAISTINALLPNIARDGHLKIFIGGHIPLMPIVIANETLGGALVFDANFSVIGKAAVLDAPVVFNALAQQLESESSLLIRGAGITEIGLGYSRPLQNLPTGKLFGGMRAKYYNVELTHGLTRLSDTNGDTEAAMDTKLDENLHESSGIGLDLGVLLVSDHYRLGASLININEPDFDYTPIDLTGYTQASILNQATQNATYSMERQLRLEGGLYSDNKRWVINATLDANAVKDPFGDEYQWATLSLAYATESWWLPGARVGYRSNQAGTGLDYLGFGLTLFKSLNFDLAYSLDDVVIDGESQPRSLMANLGLELSF